MNLRQLASKDLKVWTRTDAGFRAWARENPGIISEMLISRRSNEKNSENDWWGRISSGLA
jgi:hypothetical protein